MKTVIAMVIGALLFSIGAIALWGAVELTRTGATTETLAQSFLVPASLFVIGGFVIWMGLKGRD